MHSIRCFAALAGVFWANCVIAGDLSKIDKTIAKEPVYETEVPKYCLLVFGPEAKTRVWLVIDGDQLYADRNGNGDLTDEGERKRAITSGGKEGTFFEFGALTTINGKKVHLAVRHHPKQAEADRLILSIDGRDLQYVSSDEKGPLRFSDRPKDAPVVYFNGPLAMRPFPDQTLVRNGRMQEFSTTIGTHGLGHGTFASLACDQVPKDVHPVAEFEFPPKTAGGETIKVRVSLDQRC